MDIDELINRLENLASWLEECTPEGGWLPDTLETFQGFHLTVYEAIAALRALQASTPTPANGDAA